MSTCLSHDSEPDALDCGSVAGGIACPQQGLERPGPEPPRADPGAEAPLVSPRGPRLGEATDRPVAMLALALDRERDGRGLRQLVPEGALVPDWARREPEPGDHGGCCIRRWRRGRRRGDQAMAWLRASIGERPAGLGDELPVIARRVKRELEDPERVVLRHLAVRG